MRKSRASKKPAPKAKRTKKPSPLIIIPLIIITLFVLAATTYKIVELIILSQKDTFPTLEIFLKDVPIEQIDAGTKDIKYPGNTIAITTDGNTTNYEDAEIKGRGNFTWAQLKKPYQIKFSENTELFNHGATKKWVLLADYLDPTHLRNSTAFFLADLIDENYAHQGNPIELQIDHDYRGLYYMVKKIGVNKAGINLKNEDGVLIELDNSYGKNEDCLYDIKSNCYVVKDITNEDYTDQALENFLSSLNKVYDAIKEQDYQAISEIIDIDSFAKYYLISEFTVNPDAYNSSFYMYQDGKDAKIYAGPVWDFDMALGNKYWTNNQMDSDKIHSPFETMVFKSYLINHNASHTSASSTIIYDLMDIPEFQQRVKEIYQETLSGRGEELLDYIKSQAEYIRPAALRDQNRWKLKTNFDEEVDYLIDWVAKRYDHFEQTYGANSEKSINQNQAPESPQPSLE
ncbi:CotH kinase family protein [Candidatus Saccharibacteria bacterium]|nr:CotH kinase family protein [Candidatus Saccharibacteria bacterium]